MATSYLLFQSPRIPTRCFPNGKVPITFATYINFFISNVAATIFATLSLMENEFEYRIELIIEINFRKSKNEIGFVKKHKIINGAKNSEN